MHPLKISIPGQFWDSQIYAGRLYLFQRNGTLLTLNWDRLIEDWDIEPDQRVAFECAFRRSDYLYKADFRLLFQDSELKSLIEKKFSALSQVHLELLPEKLEPVVAGRQDSPFPFPHASCTIYSNQMYVGSQSGLFQATCDKSTKNPVSSRQRKMWDGSVYSIAASYDEIAVAAGIDGLFEIPARGASYREFTPRLELSCTSCDWAFQSIYCSSQGSGGFLADFSKRKNSEHNETVRNFERVIASDDIFDDVGFSWGRQDKLYLATSNRLDIMQYRPWEEKRLQFIATEQLGKSESAVVGGGVAFFGTVLEFGDYLLVLLSDGQRYVVDGDPIAWKVFPKSRHYENHLHVIFEDRIEILSFNQDYFVDQRKKIFGNSYLSLEFATGSYTNRQYRSGLIRPLSDFSSFFLEDDDQDEDGEFLLHTATSLEPRLRLGTG